MKVDQYINLAKECGFTQAVSLDVSSLKLMPDVRQMCEQNSCGVYGRNWSCPPGCGDLETLEREIREYSYGILVQTVGELEDDMDFESMQETEHIHKKNFLHLVDALRNRKQEMLPLGSGTCTRCKSCTYPEQPCRFPDQRISSMEAYGLLVLKVCKDNGLTYYYGPGTIAYTGCILLK